MNRTIRPLTLAVNAAVLAMASTGAPAADTAAVYQRTVRRQSTETARIAPLV